MPSLGTLELFLSQQLGTNQCGRKALALFLKVFALLLSGQLGIKQLSLKALALCRLQPLKFDLLSLNTLSFNSQICDHTFGHLLRQRPIYKHQLLARPI